MQASGEESVLLMRRQQSLLVLMRCVLQGSAKCPTGHSHQALACVLKRWGRVRGWRSQLTPMSRNLSL